MVEWLLNDPTATIGHFVQKKGVIFGIKILSRTSGRIRFDTIYSRAMSTMVFALTAMMVMSMLMEMMSIRVPERAAIHPD